MKSWRSSVFKGCLRTSRLQFSSGREVCTAGLGRVYFRSSLTHWSARESTSIKRIWAFCWDIATHHIYRISFFTVWLWQCLLFFHPVCLVFFFFFFFFFLLIGEKSSLFSFLASFCFSLQPLWASLRAASFCFTRAENKSAWLQTSKDPKRGSQTVCFSTFDPSRHPELAFYMFAAHIWPFSWQTWIYETHSASLCRVLWSWGCLILVLRKWPKETLQRRSQEDKTLDLFVL